jgi:hypothetical protein
MEAHDGCGKIGMYGKQSAMWSRNKAGPWRYSWATCPDAAHRSLTRAAQLRVLAHTLQLRVGKYISEKLSFGDFQDFRCFS